MMKKTFTLLTLIAAFVMGAAAQTITEGKLHTIKSTERGPLTVKDENNSLNSYMSLGVAGAAAKYDADDAKQQFILVRTVNTPADVYYIYSPTKGKFAGKPTSVNNIPLGDMPHPYSFVEATGANAGKYHITHLYNPTGNFSKINFTVWDGNSQGIRYDVGSADGGNLFTFQEVGDAVAETYNNARATAQTYEAQLVNQVKAQMESFAPQLGVGLGKYTKPSNWDEIYNNLTTGSDVAKVLAAFSYSKLTFQRSLPTNYDVFRIQAKTNAAKYLKAENSSDNYLKVVDASEASLFMLVGDKLVDVATGKHVGLGGSANRASMVNYGQGGAAALFAANSHHAGSYTIRLGGNRYVYAASNATQVDAGGSVNNNAGYAFNLIPVTEIPLTARVQLESGAQVGTFYTPVEGQVEGATAYTGKYNAQTQRVDFTEIPDGKIPAGSAFVFENNGTFRIGSVSAPALQNNELVGYDVSTNTAGANDYHLSLSQQKFIKVTGAKRAFRAYLLNLSAGSGVQGFDLNFGNPTAIETIAPETNDAPIFDLSGRRVNKAQQGGIYLQNGKKFIR